MVYPIVICLIYMAAVFGVTLFRLVACDRRERLRRIKNFKRGNFIFIYIATIPLYFLAHRFNGDGIDSSFWLSVRACGEMVLLRFDFATVLPLMRENLLFNIAVEVLYSFVLLNTLMFTVSVFWQTICNAVSACAARCGKKIVAVVGANEHSRRILATVPKGSKAVLIGDPDAALRDELSLLRIPYLRMRRADRFDAKVEKLLGRNGGKKLTVILNLEDDATSLLCVKKLCDVIRKKNLAELSIANDAGLEAYVFTSKDGEAAFSRYTELSMGMIRFVNRHAQIALDFIDRYPMTQYMTDEIVPERAIVKENVDLNVFMVGFGKLNESIFLASVSNNQFLTETNGALQPKLVTYHLFDRYYPQGKFSDDRSLYSDGMHCGYFRYEAFLKENAEKQDEYLPFPPLPAVVKPYPLDVSHPQFYASFRPVLQNENSYSYIIVSFGTDMENIRVAENLRQEIAEWNIKSFVKIFVKVRDEDIAREIDGDGMIEPFGSDKRCVYNAEVILREKAFRMAKMRHLLYTAEDAARSVRGKNASVDDSDIQVAAREKWNRSFRQFQRESNVFACLSARMKLQLCGFDYSDEGTDCADAFIALYEKEDKRTPSDVIVSGKRAWKYSNEEQFRPSLRWTLAVQEHQRWCANMIANGLIPCSKEEIVSLSKEQKNARWLHANLTNMEGLVKFREIMAEKTGRTAEDTDVIRYDYQLMDDIVWLLHSCGYKIVRRFASDDKTQI